MFSLYLQYLNFLFIFYQLGYKFTQIAPETDACHLRLKKLQQTTKVQKVLR